MIINASHAGTLSIGCSFALAYRKFNIQVRRHGRFGYGRPNRYGNLGPNSFVVLHEPIRKPDKEAESAADLMFADLIARGDFIKVDATFLIKNLRETTEGEENGLKYEFFSICVFVPLSVLAELARLGIGPHDFFDAFVDGRAYFDNNHSHNHYVVETLHDLLRDTKHAIDRCLATIDYFQKQGLRIVNEVTTFHMPTNGYDNLTLINVRPNDI